MPFVQMENIALFLEACKSPPFNLQSHDVFLTVDLYESKDPAQVLQCIGAFSRAAHRVDPSKFPNAVGGKSRGYMSPQGTGTPTVGGGSYGSRGRGVSNASNTSSAYNPNTRPLSAMSPSRTGDSNSGRWSPTKTSTPMSPGVSSWSKKSDEGATSPAWNIAQYGYMGGASQGNLGVSFGARRQLTSASPHVPSLADKEKKRREKEAEEDRLRMEAEENERRRQEELHAEEERARIAEEQRWAEETRRLRDQERKKVEEERRQWEEDERRWKVEEEKRQQEEREAETKSHEERQRLRGNSDARLQGQFLSQYQSQNGISSNGQSSESSRIQELERELAKARERERDYERERQTKLSSRNHQVVEDYDLSTRIKEEDSRTRSRSHSKPQASSHQSSDEAWRVDERDYLRKQWASQHSSSDSPNTSQAPAKPPRPLPEPAQHIAKQSTGSRPMPTPPIQKQSTGSRPVPALPIAKQHTGSRPLPNPADYAAPQPKVHQPPPSTHATQNRTDRFLSSNPAPQAKISPPTYSSETASFSSTSERDAEDRRRLASQQKTKAGGWASKSLLEREMELERQRQQEWEEGQKEVKSKVVKPGGVDGIGGGIGGKWDVNQWTGYTGGDGQNKGSQGIGVGRRQIVGPRPPPGR